MKDKEKQIQEIAQIICGRSKDDICIIDYASCDSSCYWARTAEAIYNVGYRKIDDDCAVITKDELKQYKAQAVKEFAEMLKNNCAYSFIFGQKFITEKRIDELLKEYEVKE